MDRRSLSPQVGIICYTEQGSAMAAPATNSQIPSCINKTDRNVICSIYITSQGSVAAGEQMVGPKRIVFGDEISTGLDSSTTYQIIKWMRDTCHHQLDTMLIALLQPAPETWALFDDLLLIAEGMHSLVDLAQIAAAFVVETKTAVQIRGMHGHWHADQNSACLRQGLPSQHASSCSSQPCKSLHVVTHQTIPSSVMTTQGMWCTMALLDIPWNSSAPWALSAPSARELLTFCRR